MQIWPMLLVFNLGHNGVNQCKKEVNGKAHGGMSRDKRIQSEIAAKLRESVRCNPTQIGEKVSNILVPK